MGRKESTLSRGRPLALLKLSKLRLRMPKRTSNHRYLLGNVLDAPSSIFKARAQANRTQSTKHLTSQKSALRRAQGREHRSLLAESNMVAELNLNSWESSRYRQAQSQRTYSNRTELNLIRSTQSSPSVNRYPRDLKAAALNPHLGELKASAKLNLI